MLVAKSLLSWGKTSSLYDILENGGKIVQYQIEFKPFFFVDRFGGLSSITKILENALQHDTR